MKLNWKVRFKNKVFLCSFIGLIISFVYGMLQLFDVYPPVTENQILNIVNQCLTFLGLLGIINDPTTSGISDSNRALSYDHPWDDATDNEDPNG